MGEDWYIFVTLCIKMGCCNMLCCSFHSLCSNHFMLPSMDNYVPSVTAIYLHLWWTCLDIGWIFLTFEFFLRKYFLKYLRNMKKKDFEVAAPPSPWHSTLAIPSKQLQFIHPILTEYKKVKKKKKIKLQIFLENFHCYVIFVYFF